MTQLKDNEHDWTWLPEFGENYSYCERCDKVMIHKTGEIITYRAALKLVEPKRAASTLGSMTSEKKQASSRENGKKGGRPRKAI